MSEPYMGKIQPSVLVSVFLHVCLLNIDPNKISEGLFEQLEWNIPC